MVDFYFQHFFATSFVSRFLSNAREAEKITIKTKILKNVVRLAIIEANIFAQFFGFYFIT